MSSMILHTRNKILEPKNFFSEVRCKKDVDNFLEHGLILLDVVENDLDKLLLGIIKKLLHNKESVKAFDDPLDNVLLNKASILKNSIQYYDQNANQDDGLNERWLFSNVDFSFISKTYVAIVRLKNEMYFGPYSKHVKMFVLVLSPLNEKRVKNSIEVARTFSTLFLDDNLRKRLLNTKSKSDALLQIKNETEKRCKNSFSLNHLDMKEAEIYCVPKFRFSVLKGLRNDLKNVAKYYKSDFIDIFKDRKSQFKAISTTVFLYFTIILPTIAFGSVNDKNTNGMIDAQRALIGQFVGGIVFALLAGQPLTIVATTAPLCLYTKIIFDFSSSFQVDFYSMFAWVGIFNFAFLVIFSVLDLSQLMKFSTRGVEDIFSTFIFFAFTLDAFHDINRLFQDDYSSCDSTASNLANYLSANLTDSTFDSNTTTTLQPDLTTYLTTESFMNFTNDNQTSFKPFPCDKAKDRPILAIFLCLITFWLANKLSTLTKTSLFTRERRELISDYSLPISILFFSLIANTVFQITPKDEFVVNNSHPTGFASLFLPSECILICLGLGFSLSLLFFMDQNISAALVQTPENNLKKANSYDLDLILIGVINLFLSLLGFPFMHGILPHSPLHAKNLAEVEYVVENGSVKENVLFVRETRVTAIMSHILIGLSLLMIPYPINLIPISVLDGLFLFCAISTLIDNSLFDRFILFITEQKSYPVNNVISKCPQRTVHKFTLIQIAELLVVCLFGFAPWPAVKMAFPIIIFLTIPFRKFVLTRIFTDKDISVLDSYKH